MRYITLLLAIILSSSLLSSSIAQGVPQNGTKISKGYLEIYYKDGITKEQAEKALQYFYPIWKDEEDTAKIKSIQFYKVADTVTFCFVSNMDIMEKIDDEIFYITGNEVSQNIFDTVPVNVVLTDGFFKPIKSYTFKKMDAPNYGERATAGNIEVFVKGESIEIGQALANLLEDEMHPASTYSFQLIKNDKGKYVVKMVSNEEAAQTVPEEDLHDICTKISTKILKGSPLTFELTDSQLKPVRTYEYKGDVTSH